MSNTLIVEPGATFRTPFPFLASKKQLFDEAGAREIISWRPGLEYEAQPPEGGWSKSYCNGWGSRIIEIISLHKPGKYPERVFFTRRWQPPNGAEFGKSACRVTTLSTMRRWLRDGHPYPTDEDVIHVREFERAAA